MNNSKKRQLFLGLFDFFSLLINSAKLTIRGLLNSLNNLVADSLRGDLLSQCLMIYSDGGARGNPGPAAIGFIATNANGALVKEDSRFLGIRTNNQAEYEALLLALRFAVDQKAQELICHLDSELVVKQLNGQYAVKNTELAKLKMQVRSLLSCFSKVSFVNVRRTHPKIQRADELVNLELDEQVCKGLKKKNNASHSSGCDNDFFGAFVHASIRTSNMQRSIDFYSIYFGLKIQGRHVIEQTNAEIVFLQDPKGKGCTLELTQYRNQKEFLQAKYEQRLFDHLGFEVADINKTILAMKKADVTISDEPRKFNENTTIAFVEDPDGTLIELIERR